MSNRAYPLLKLTAMARPDVNDFQSTPLYVEPSYIVGITYGSIRFNSMDGKPLLHPQAKTQGTTVLVNTMQGVANFPVEETPEEVASLRDQAMEVFLK